MKRSREETPMNSRPQTSSAQPPMVGGSNGQKLTTNDALSYLKSVKDMFQDSREKYDEFLEVMKDFKAQRIHTVGVIERVKDLFKGHRDLVLGFNTFLPKGYHVTLPAEDEATPAKKPVEFQEAIRFVNKVKTRFQGDDRVYKAFLDILNVYRKENKPIAEVYEEVSALFSQHPDLLVEFKQFLPDTTATSLPYNAGKSSLVRREGNSALPNIRHIHSEKPITLHANHDRRIDQPDVDTDGDPNRELEDRNFDHKGQQISQKLKSSSKIEDFVGEHFLKGGENGENSGPHADSSSNGAGIYGREFAFCEKVKERFSNSDCYEGFMNSLDAHGKGDLSRPDLENQVRNLFGRHQDLVEGFIDTFPQSGNIDGFLAALKKKSTRPLKVDERDKHSDRDRTDGQKDREQGSERIVAFGTSNGSSQRMSLYTNKDKYAAKPIHELDLSDCDQCTPSYRLLPSDYPIPIASQRTGIGRAVLNDNWVSVTSGSEDYSFKHMRKNQYEESLFRCEDDRFELDMLLGSVGAATKRVEDLLNKITDNSVATDSTFNINDHLTALNLRCIERIYSDHGLDVMDVLKKNAPLALPVILTRLKQKQEEWARCRADFNKVWAEIYAKNHHKSLDHRSFYFKQQDSKSLSTKALLAEIKELRETKFEDNNDMLLTTAIGNRGPVIPEMEFEFPDSQIHDDVYKLIKYSCGEVCSSEQLDKVLNIWTTFLEPILGVPRRAQGTEDREDVLTSNNSLPLELNSSSRNEYVRAGIVNGENGVEENESKNLDAHRVGNGDEISWARAREISNGNSSNAETASGLPAVSARPSNGGRLARHQMRLNGKHISSLEGREVRRPVASINAVTTEAVLVNGHSQGSFGLLRVEREEGELSPNGDFEEVNFPNVEGLCLGEVGENDADDEGSGPRSREDSENASENGDATGSESNDAENGSHEEGDHDENENKVASESDCVGEVLPCAERHLVTAKPLRKHVNQGLQVRDKNSRIFYGNDSIYVLFRLHQALYDRIHTAKVNVSERRWKGSDASSPADLYSRFLSGLYNLLDGSYDSTKFEDECRAIIGTQSYILFTLDKLIFKIVKQLQSIATDEAESRLFLLYAYENSRKRETFEDVTYHQNVSVLLQEENIYRIECLRSQQLVSSPTRMSIKIVENAHEKPEGVSMDPKFMEYIFHDYLSSIPEHKLASNLFLKRNMRKYRSEGQYTAAVAEVQLTNGLEIRISPTSHKGLYVLGTEDVLFRSRNNRRTVHQNGFSHDHAKSSNKFLSRTQRFNILLSGQIDNLTR